MSIFWLFLGAFSWFWVGEELWEELYQAVVTKKEGCGHTPFITPILRADTTHKPVVRLPGWLPEDAEGTLREGAVEETEMQK